MIEAIEIHGNYVAKLHNGVDFILYRHRAKTHTYKVWTSMFSCLIGGSFLDWAVSPYMCVSVFAFDNFATQNLPPALIAAAAAAAAVTIVVTIFVSHTTTRKKQRK